MKLLLADVLRCPRCGPEHGLVLLADHLDGERVVQRGQLGCANCRARYPIRDAVPDLRLPGDPPAPPVPPREGEEALRLAALLGLGEGSGRVTIRGPGVARAAAVAALAPEVEIVALLASPAEAKSADGAGVTRLVAGPRLPFAAGSLRGVALTDGCSPEAVASALRTLGSGGRLLVDRAGAEVAEAVRAAGARILLGEEDTLLAEPGAAPPVARVGSRG